MKRTPQAPSKLEMDTSKMRRRVIPPPGVILHCSATHDYPIGHEVFDVITAATINDWHKRRWGSGIGYHWFIRRSGYIELGRDIRYLGAHTEGYNENLGVCWAGTRWPTEAQIAGILQIYTLIKRDFGITWHDWRGHYEFTNKKTCPGIPMPLVRALLQYYDEVISAYSIAKTT